MQKSVQSGQALSREFSPREVARALGVSESSVKRWCDRGVLQSHRTVGGHRKVAINEVLRFARDDGYDLETPSALGLPEIAGVPTGSTERAANELFDSLQESNVAQVRRVLLGLYLARLPLADIADLVVAPAFHRLGVAWDCGDTEVYIERLGVNIVMRTLQELRLLQTESRDAPRAIGAALQGDRYTIPITLAEVVLREEGWNAIALGCDLPVDTLIAAIRNVKPRFVFLSFSAQLAPDSVVDMYSEFYEQARELGCAVVIGGQSLSVDMRAQMRCTARCSSMNELVGFADGFKSAS